MKKNERGRSVQARTRLLCLQPSNCDNSKTCHLKDLLNSPSLFSLANCQKACKKCDEARPCPRCVKYGISDTCVNSTRKERKKGVKRGPYKRRQKGGKFFQSKPNHLMQCTDIMSMMKMMVILLLPRQGPLVARTAPSHKHLNMILNPSGPPYHLVILMV